MDRNGTMTFGRIIFMIRLLEHIMVEVISRSLQRLKNQLHDSRRKNPLLTRNRIPSRNPFLNPNQIKRLIVNNHRSEQPLGQIHSLSPGRTINTSRAAQ